MVRYALWSNENWNDVRLSRMEGMGEDRVRKSQVEKQVWFAEG